eukprot:GHVN01003727.1.p1 GENE.GHVN01003727.1~~GHVN01003727.1.p1  ORF type:complete len:900 (+),score=164.61 GHVN01003727.1:69-2768(+)
MTRHRPHLTQKNKKFKGPSKRSASVSGRRTSVLSACVAGNAAKSTTGVTKSDRKNKIKVGREVKVKSAVTRKRLGSQLVHLGVAPPRVALILSFHRTASAVELKEGLIRLVEGETSDSGLVADATMLIDPLRAGGPYTMRLPKWAGHKRMRNERVTFVDAPRDDIRTVLDLAKTADVLVCVFGEASLENPAFDAIGYRLMLALKRQGLPPVIGAAVTPPILENSKAAQANYRFVVRYFQSELQPDGKVYILDTPESLKPLLRAISGSPVSEFEWRQNRGFMLVDEWESDADTQRLKVMGYARGVGFTVKHPVHITGVGDFAVERILVLPDCTSKDRPSGISVAEPHVAAELESSTRDELRATCERLQPYDPWSGEQTWPTDEEMAEARHGRRRGKGTSGEAQGDSMPAGSVCHVGLEGASDEESYDGDGSDVGSEVGDEEAEEQMSNRKRCEMEERRRDDMDFPDEVDTPTTQRASDRFQKYQGLKSWRSSKWDNKMELPVEYGRITEFENFNKTSLLELRTASAECRSMGLVGLRVCLVLIPFGQFMQSSSPTPSQTEPHPYSLTAPLVSLRGPLLKIEDDKNNKSHLVLQHDQPLVVSSVIPLEMKVSVAHCQVTREREFEGALPSKKTVEIQSGFRRFLAKPIFSEVPGVRSQDKYRYERFLHPGTTRTASFYGPSIFTSPTPVLMFSEPIPVDDPARDAPGVEFSDRLSRRPSVIEAGDSVSDSAASRIGTRRQSATSSMGLTSVRAEEKANLDEWRDVVPGREASELAAWGSTIGSDPNRLIIKRVLLTGYPYRIHKSKAVIRFMFFNPKDIRYFKPVELHTKLGLRGHIKESLGTHGYMKCVFNDRLQPHDTVCMALYKRVFPKWYPLAWHDDPSRKPSDGRQLVHDEVGDGQ